VDDAQPGTGRSRRTGLDPGLYPDIAEAGSLRDALRAELDRAGQHLSVQPERAPGWRYVGARVEDAGRITTVVLGIRERVFTMEFWSAGVCMARGNTEDLGAVAGAMQLWQSGARVRELSTACPFVRFDGLGEAYERSEAAEYTWRRYHENPRHAPHLARLHAFIAEAIREPRLTALLPFTSIGTLGFADLPRRPSNCRRYPSVTPVGGDRYQVRAADGRDLGTADALGSLALVLAVMPTGEVDSP
jgi:hypothetical protein